MQRVVQWGGIVVGIAVLGLGAATWRLWWLLLPLSATGEAERLAAALGVGHGSVVADIGAGSGAMAERMTGLAGRDGSVYATELAADRRAEIVDRKLRRGLDRLQVVTAAPDATGLPDACCDALYMRHVFHHLDDRAALVASMTRAVRPGGRIAIIDFPPGLLWFEGVDHGVTADDVRSVFSKAGWREREHQEAWGGGTFLVVFER